MAKILVVNNDIDTMTLLQKWLQTKNHEAKYTGNGEEVPQLIKNFNPDVLLIDVLHGDVVEKIKGDKKLSEVPLIMMTGYTIKDQDAFIKNADDIIEKPFNLNLLEKKIEKFLQKTG